METVEFLKGRRRSLIEVGEFVVREVQAIDAQIAPQVPEQPGDTGGDPQPGEPRGEPGGEPQPEEPREGPGGETGGEPQPEEPGEETPSPTPVPTPTPTPGPTPPVTGGYDAYGPAELVAKLRSAAGGETIVAKQGYDYGNLTLDGIKPTSEVTIMGEGPNARFGQIAISNSRKIRIYGIGAYMLTAPARTKVKPYLIRALPSTSEITVEGCVLKSRLDAENYDAWSLTEWLAWRMGGVFLEGADSHITNNDCFGLEMGLGVAGAGSTIVANDLRGLGGDALRLTADDTTATHNTAHDFYYLRDGNHTDPLQVFSKTGDGKISGVTIVGNDFRALVTNRNNPLAAMKCQGIGAYMSPGKVNTVLSYLIVEDNYVEATAWVGTGFTVAANGSIQRNRIVDALGRTDGHSKLHISGACANTIVADNIAPRLAISAGAQQSGNKVA